MTVAPSGEGHPALQLLEGGAPNSRQSDTSGASSASGFDTVRLRFRRQEGAYHQAEVPHAAVHARGELDGLVTVEARRAALLYGEDDEFLRALSYVDLPWLKAGVEGAKRDNLQTVYHRDTRGRSVKLRFYDKGVESDTAASGTGCCGPSSRTHGRRSSSARCVRLVSEQKG